MDITRSDVPGGWGQRLSLVCAGEPGHGDVGGLKRRIFGSLWYRPLIRGGHPSSFNCPGCLTVDVLLAHRQLAVPPGGVGCSFVLRGDKRTLRWILRPPNLSYLGVSLRGWLIYHRPRRRRQTVATWTFWELGCDKPTRRVKFQVSPQDPMDGLRGLQGILISGLLELK